MAACLAGGGAVFELEPPSTPGGAMVMTSNGAIYRATALPIRQPPGDTIFEIVPK
jgi:hypothetical protein